MKTCFLYFLFLVSFFTVKAQNCNTFPFYLSDHIRNGSFEQPGSCFSSLSTLPRQPFMETLIPYWHFATTQTRLNYYGECNRFRFPYDSSIIVINPNVHIIYAALVPLPIPDGKGIIGMSYTRSLDGSPSVDTFSQKFYVANFLSRPLKKDSLYRLSLYVGFGIQDTLGALFFMNSPVQTKLSIFGLADSTRIPTSVILQSNGKGGGGYGCLTQNNQGWIDLGSVFVPGGRGYWTRDSITFSVPEDIQALAIGPACDLSNVATTIDQHGIQADYIFLDKLQLYQSPVPQPVIELVGDLCDKPDASVTLQMKFAKFYAASKLKWYKDNVLINATGGSITITKLKFGEGVYQCSVENDSVCAFSNSIRVVWDPVIKPLIGNGTDTTACLGDTVTLRVDGGPNATYLWLENLSTTPVNYFAHSGTFSVRISNSCTTLVAHKTINFIECPATINVPSAFSPNHDGLNDVFRARPQGVIRTFSMEIYNRSGQRVFYSTDISKGWDGTINRVMQNQGTFVWVVHYTDGLDVANTLHGTVVLIR